MTGGWVVAGQGSPSAFGDVDITYDYDHAVMVPTLSSTAEDIRKTVLTCLTGGKMSTKQLATG